MAKEDEEIKDNVEDTEESNPEVENPKEDIEAETEDSEVESPKEDDSDTSEEIKPDANELALLQLLRNPETATLAAKVLAEKAGFRLSTTPIEAKKTLADEIKEVMGDEFDQIPRSAWKAIDKVIEAKLATIQAEINETKQSQVEKDSMDATEKLYTNFPDAKNYEKQIVKLMTEITPTEGLSMYRYLTRLYRIAKSEAKSPAGELQKQYTKRVARNASEVSLTSSGASDKDIRTQSKRPTIDEAVQQALREMKKGR